MSGIFSHLRRGFGENVRFAFLAVRAHKLRAFLTVLGIVVGVATVIAMVSIVNGFNQNMVRNFQSFGATLVQFQKFEARFGPGHRDESERNRKDLTYEEMSRYEWFATEHAAKLAAKYGTRPWIYPSSSPGEDAIDLEQLLARIASGW